MRNLQPASVGVVIPSYNSADFLEETVTSVLAQSVPVSQIVVIDDASPDDDSFAIAQRLAASHPHIISIRQENAGAAAARNAGFSLLDTEFVIFLDADDRLAPDAVAHHLEAFAARPDAVMVLGSKNIIDAAGRLLSEPRDPVEVVDREKLALRVTPGPSQCMYRSDVFERAGRLDPSLRPGDEIDLNLRLERVGEIYSHAKLAMDYREHPGQGTRRRVSNARAHLAALEKNLGPGAPEPDPALWRLARRYWLSRYGRAQFRAAVGQVRRGNLSDAVAPARLWLDAVPAWLHDGLFGKPQIP
ncbi:MAG: glycosyltransferase family 2 protein [Boseongicola sp.]|nr:glycosyltransferase family 2 protein [Silicimonas sp.]NNF92048.1 glycosyltransferase family 2 protein [Boseongicola sp.]